MKRRLRNAAIGLAITGAATLCIWWWWGPGSIPWLTSHLVTVGSEG